MERARWPAVGSNSCRLARCLVDPQQDLCPGHGGVSSVAPLSFEHEAWLARLCAVPNLPPHGSRVGVGFGLGVGLGRVTTTSVCLSSTRSKRPAQEMLRASRFARYWAPMQIRAGPR